MPTPYAIAGVLVVCAALAYALVPLLRRRLPPRLDVADGAIVAHAEEERLLDEREAVYRALAELDFDRQLGNLGESEYQELRERERKRAVAVLRALDGHEPSLDRQIERAVALQRVARREGGGTASALAQRAATQPRVPRRIGGRDLPLPTDEEGPRGQRRAVAALAAFLALVALVAVLVPLLSGGRGGQTALATVTVAQPRGLAATSGPTPILFVAAADGLLASVDRGQTWVAVPGVSGAGIAVLGSPDPATPWYAATSEGIYRSADGARWERVGNQPSASLVALARGSAPGTLYAAGGDGRVYRSADGGTTWDERGHAPAPPTALVVLGGAVEALALGTDGSGVLVSVDGGGTWGQANGFANGLLESTRVRALALDPNSGDSATNAIGRAFSGTLYAGTDAGLSRTLDGGSSWSRLPFRGDVRLLGAALAADRPAALYLLDAQARLFRSVDRGVTWPGG